MKKTILTLLIPLALAACTGTGDKKAADTSAAKSDEAKSVPADQLITPGESIGHIKLGEPADSVVAVLGKPDSSDAAMGSALMTWFAKHDPQGYRTTIFAHRNMGSADEEASRTKRVLVTSPFFKTKEGLATGASLDKLSETYDLKRVNSLKAMQKDILVFDDVKNGITFDIDSSSRKCVAITVHVPGDSTARNLNMY